MWLPEMVLLVASLPPIPKPFHGNRLIASPWIAFPAEAILKPFWFATLLPSIWIRIVAGVPPVAGAAPAWT